MQTLRCLKHPFRDSQKIEGGSKIPLLGLSRNLSKIRAFVGDSHPPTKANIKGRMKYHQIDDDEEWRVYLGKEILDIKTGRAEVEGFDPKDLDEILTYICIS